MHLLAGEAMTKIRSGHYDVVVLQDHSLRAIDHPSALERDAMRFKLAVDATHGRTVLYQTWARHPGAHLYRKHPQVHSFDQMAAQTDRTYAEIARRTGTTLAPVGTAFEHAFASDPELLLWGTRPWPARSWRPACSTPRSPGATRALRTTFRWA